MFSSTNIKLQFYTEYVIPRQTNCTTGCVKVSKIFQLPSVLKFAPIETKSTTHLHWLIVHIMFYVERYLSDISLALRVSKYKHRSLSTPRQPVGANKVLTSARRRDAVYGAITDRSIWKVKNKQPHQVIISYKSFNRLPIYFRLGVNNRLMGIVCNLF